MPGFERRPSLLLAAVILAVAVAAPVVVGADPSPSPKAAASAKPDKSPHPAKAPKAEKSPAIAITLIGIVIGSTDAKGRPTFSLKSAGITYELSAGPKWFWGKNNPLATFVGKSVKVIGTHQEGSTDVDVDTVDGKALRGGGRPPWAGGPRAVGEKHPGWKAWKADGKHGNGKGREGAPGQLKDKTQGDSDDSDEPEASAAPKVSHQPDASKAPAASEAPRASASPTASETPSASASPAASPAAS
jgi:hypothetical protein